MTTEFDLKGFASVNELLATAKLIQDQKIELTRHAVTEIESCIKNFSNDIVSATRPGSTLSTWKKYGEIDVFDSGDNGPADITCQGDMISEAIFLKLYGQRILESLSHVTLDDLVDLRYRANYDPILGDE